MGEWRRRTGLAERTRSQLPATNGRTGKGTVASERANSSSSPGRRRIAQGSLAGPGVAHLHLRRRRRRNHRRAASPNFCRIRRRRCWLTTNGRPGAKLHRTELDQAKTARNRRRLGEFASLQVGSLSARLTWSHGRIEGARAPANAGVGERRLRSC